jgi:hypothetical protein
MSYDLLQGCYRRRRGFLGHKRQLQMIDNSVHHDILRDKGDDLSYFRPTE